jgi:UDP-2,4-diacetamido-2,4,6-trideoxy-beta-L-altropyranose hydrolase
VAGTLVIRTDASGGVGTGHVMRCLALVQAWQARGGRTIWIGHCPIEELRRRIRAAEAAFEPLERPHPDPADLAATRASLSRIARESDAFEIIWLVLDGMHFDPAYQEAVRPAEGRMLVIDDLAAWPRYHADLLLNQNLGAQRHPYLCDDHASFLLGPRYALLRREFLPQESWRRKPIELGPGRPARILVTLGGADSQNATALALEGLKRLDLPWEARVVLGAATPPGKTPAPPVCQPGQKIQLLSDVKNMPEQMAWADVALSAAGSTCWEMAFMELPAAVIVLADNQRAVAEPLAEAGTLVNLGPLADVTADRVAAELGVLCRDAKRRFAMGQSGRRLVDARGAERVVAVMSALDDPLPDDKLLLRLATRDDLLPLWRLANDRAVRQFSLSPEPITLEEHTAWFQEKLAREETAIWVFDFHGLILATVRYDRVDPQTAEVSLSVAPAFRRRGLGTKLLQRNLRLIRDRLGVKRLRAVVRQENIPSARIFAKSGFRQVDTPQIQGHACQVFEREV